MIKYNKKKAIYSCCLSKAGFRPPSNYRLKFKCDSTLKKLVDEKFKNLDIETGITVEDAEGWFLCAWENRNEKEFQVYKQKNGKDWFSDEMKTLMVFLTQKKENGQSVSGFDKFKKVAKMHTHSTDDSFEVDISKHVRTGGIVIIDLSQGDPTLQKVFSERICKRIFADSMQRFTDAAPNNFIQFYFEEAHNLFPKKDDKDLSQIYNRIAKEGAKLNLGMVYATQEVSSISSNILKNTQNWFIAHLNNEDEIKELRKYYDFNDFADSLIRFSAKNDKGFVRMKTYSNPFVVPVQIDKFSV